MTTAASIQTDDLAGTRALVSGGTRGTGAAVAARLKDAGWSRSLSPTAPQRPQAPNTSSTVERFQPFDPSQESNQTSGALGVPLFFDAECVAANHVAPCNARIGGVPALQVGASETVP